MAVKKYIVLSALGKDRPGFINGISASITKAGGNIEMQRSTRMADEFAAIILFSLTEEDRVQEVMASLRELGGEDCVVNVREALSLPTGEEGGVRLYEMEASGADQPGVVEAVTLVLYKEHVNVESMDYETESAPMTGEHLFCMKAQLAVPEAVDIERLHGLLRELEAAWNFDILLRPRTDG